LAEGLHGAGDGVDEVLRGAARGALEDFRQTHDAQLLASGGAGLEDSRREEDQAADFFEFEAVLMEGGVFGAEFGAARLTDGGPAGG